MTGAGTGVMSRATTRATTRRWVLWGLMFSLLVALLVALVFLARQYEDALAQERLERSANNMAADIRNGLLRNLQNLQALYSSSQGVDQWGVNAAALLSRQREVVRLEWRSNDLQLLALRTSPYQPNLFHHLPREQALPEVWQACDVAGRTSAPAYSASYFWPMAQGVGQEIFELCLPLRREGQSDGFLVATYAMPGLLTELIDPDQRRGDTVSVTEPDGTRLTTLSTGSVAAFSLLRATQVLELPGGAYVLRVERPRSTTGWLPHILTVGVGLLALTLLVVLGLLARDMGRRLRAERGLAEALAFRKAMEDSLVTGLRARDMEGRTTYVNPAFCQMVGLSAEQLVGSGVPAPYWPPEQSEEYRERLAVRLAGRTLPREGFESEFVRSDGIRFPVLIIEAPLIDARGQQTGWMSAILDLSEQRRVEELSRASQERLQATARLAMAGEMASMISHELNQPLAAIASYASGTLNLLQEGAPHSTERSAERPAGPHEAPLTLDAEQRGMVEQAIRRMAEQAERAGKVIKSVGDLVRRREHDREPVQVASLFDAILPLLQLQARKMSIELRLEVAPRCPRVVCDRTMIEQVLLNLARNGMQAMPVGAPPAASGLRRLTMRAALVGLTAERSQRAWVEFVVTDHGTGLPEAVADRMFIPFFTTKAEGMGLGLNLCRTVVEQHGGALRFEPAQPCGTTFRFTLPAERAERAERTDLAERSGAAGVSSGGATSGASGTSGAPGAPGVAASTASG